MPRTPDEAIAWGIRQSISPTQSYRGLCLQFVRHALGVPREFPSARSAWEALPATEHRQGRPPAGAPVFWEVGEFWHVAVHIGSWVYLSNDVQRAGLIDVVPGALIRQRWGARYLGWSSLLNGVRLPL
jgi:hypothetical protein